MGKKIEFMSEGILLRSKLHFPSGFDENRLWPIVIMATGDGKKGSGSSSWPPLINSLLRKNIPVFIFDFQGLGESDGVYEEFTISVAIKNLKDSVKKVKSFSWVDSSRIGVLGSSFGGSATLIVQGFDRPFKVLGLKSPASFIPEAYENEHNENGMEKWEKYGISPISGYKFQAYLESFNYNIYDLAKNIKEKILIVHGDSDTIVPLRQSKRLKFIIGKSVKVTILTGVDHDYKQGDALSKLATAQSEFFGKFL